MAAQEKGRSPFYPSQPVPRELFTGRQAEINRLTKQGVAQVAMGKPVAAYIQGEYGIGKSSIAALVEALAEQRHQLHTVHAYLSGARDLDDVARLVLEATVKSGALNASRSEKLRSALAKYIGRQELFGISVDLTAVRADAPTLVSASSMLEFLGNVQRRLEAPGLVLVLDEINGVTKNSEFAHFVKRIVDENATQKVPLPLLLMLCGVEERRREMIEHVPSIDRVFDLVVEIGAMTPAETEDFYRRAFQSVQMTVSPEALSLMTHSSDGLPKVMHIIGDAAFWADDDNRIDLGDATRALAVAAEDIGRKYVDSQVLDAIRSRDYRAILGKIAQKAPFSPSFSKSEIVPHLTSAEQKKFSNFLTKMKSLNVIRPGVEKGEFEFVMRMVRVYLSLIASGEREPSRAPGSSPAGSSR